MEEDAHDQAFNQLPVLIRNAAMDTKKFFMGNYDPTIFVDLFASKLDDTTFPAGNLLYEEFLKWWQCMEILRCH